MFTLEQLERIVAERANAGVDESYTASLVAGGAATCARKLGEEAVETIVAAMAGKPADLTKEAADLLYHLLVLLQVSSVRLPEVMAELESRTAMSGLEEKAGRA